ncbi:Wadjet anti-phage system protein JetD domain-containing protein [Saccharopolyspora phatthalungensis]|uniref:Wadjet protein JetD C-terminal domain-containing protein n=1 Tax=Saccharopolyspora phatthalungensis TaxID=664693 RepID=A0A840Q827_9PSEU|nr:Wadjet anti-phage system protein JetD domain-containing protein [Saccharopolyspora phatthalungensis]MBB5156874.1 hypothetical protein [Saccharopolyspora phatthalungensis]
MTNEPTDVPDVLHTPSWAWLRTTVRNRLETDGSAATVVIDTDKLTDGESRVFRWLLKVPATRRGEVRVRLSRLDRELAERVTNGVDLHSTLAFLGGPLDDQRARKRQQREDRIVRDQETYDEVVRLAATVPELEREYTALVSSPPSPALRVPPGSRSGTTSWAVYELALRAAVVWWAEDRDGRRVTAKELAGKAWRNTKTAWTLPRRFAFGNLIHDSFDAAVDEADTELRMRGPLTWVAEDTVADASTSTPWIGLPALGLRTLGYSRFTARGVLLVENSDAFERVCRMPEVVDSWLCIWGGGFASEGLVRFLRPLSVPIAAWQDLDVDGIRIIDDLSKRLGRTVSAIGMSVALWENGVKRVQDPESLSRARGLAEELAVHGPAQLRGLAARIAKTGKGCEHETLYSQVLPTLGRDLKALEV